jgi:hypothetical protein
MSSLFSVKSISRQRSPGLRGQRDPAAVAWAAPSQ